MHHFELDAALGDHVGRDGRVDAAGEQADRHAAHADRQTARALFSGAVDIGRIVANLNVDDELGVVDIDLARRERLMQRAADLLGDLDRRQGEGLVGALALDLEALRRAHVARKVLLRRGDDLLDVLFARQRLRNGDDAEDLLAALKRGLNVALVVLRLDVDGALLGVDAEIAAFRHAAVDVRHQLIFEAAAVQALEHDLAELAQDHFMHWYCSPHLLWPLPHRRKMRLNFRCLRIWQAFPLCG